MEVGIQNLDNFAFEICIHAPYYKLRNITSC